MVSILPSDRTGLDVLGKYLGQGASNAMPQMYENMKYQRGMSAIDKLQEDLKNSGNDISKMLPAIARAYTANPNLERSGIAEHALRRAQTNIGRPSELEESSTDFSQKNPIQTNQQQAAVEENPSQMMENQEIEKEKNIQPNPEYFSSNPFNTRTLPEMQKEATRYANAIGDPNAYGTRLNELQRENEIANSQREALENMALKSGVGSDELPRFMQVGSRFDYHNPSQWAQQTKRAYDQVKSNDQKLQNAFIPGIGNALLGTNRQEALDRLGETVRDQVKLGLEQETRKFLASNYVTPTEIETMIHPLNDKQKKNISGLISGIFPQEKSAIGAYERGKFKPTLSYSEAVERAPKEMQQFKNILSDFFVKNVDKDTSLLALRDKLINEKHYDWRQIGPAIREAMNKGLKLEPHQSTEMSTLETQEPFESLGAVFKDWARIPMFLRGSK